MKTLNKVKISIWINALSAIVIGILFLINPQESFQIITILAGIIITFTGIINFIYYFNSFFSIESNFLFNIPTICVNFLTRTANLETVVVSTNIKINANTNPHKKIIFTGEYTPIKSDIFAIASGIQTKIISPINTINHGNDNFKSSFLFLTILYIMQNNNKNTTVITICKRIVIFYLHFSTKIAMDTFII